jgi:glycosyltransferase involved in cell wall biosynthesis
MRTQEMTDKTSPQVDIVTVVYNGEAFLEETIQSVLAQDYPQLGYHIVDGGSTDGTMAIIDRYRERLASVVSEPDKGMYDALNKGITKTDGDIWMSLNADDRLVSNDVVSTVVAFSKKPTAAKTGAFFGNIMKEKGGTTRRVRFGEVDFATLLSSGHCTFMPQPATFIRRSLLNEVGGFDLAYRYASDYDFHLRLLRAGRVVHVDKYFTIFRQHDGALTATGADKMNQERLAIIEQYRTEVPALSRLLLRYWGWGKYLLHNRVFPAR